MSTFIPQPSDCVRECVETLRQMYDQHYGTRNSFGIKYQFTRLGELCETIDDYSYVTNHMCDCYHNIKKFRGRAVDKVETLFQILYLVPLLSNSGESIKIKKVLLIKAIPFMQEDPSVIEETLRTFGYID